MTVTLEQAQASLAQYLDKAEAGEEILIGRDLNHPIAKLVSLNAKASRLSRHPELIGSTATHDPAALVNPLPPEEWGELADR